MDRKKYVKTTIDRLAESAKEKEKYSFTVLEKKFVIFPNVFSPKYFGDTAFFAKNIPVTNGEDFLEIGCGSGIISVFAALRGASRVVAIDISPDAVENTKENVALHKLSDKIIALQGDVYSSLDKTDRFDTIFWNIPFLETEMSNLSQLDLSVFDSNYKSTQAFIKNAKSHLKKDGRLLIGFSTTMGDFDRIQVLCQEQGFSLKVIRKTVADYGFPIGKVNLELFEASA